MKVITRFAPSPTGMLHIGGARTALFNYFFSRHHGGKFLLRIEDTDSERSTKESCDTIIQGLKWLGINWDDEIVYQSKNEAKHVALANKLVADGFAYLSFEKKVSHEDGTHSMERTDHPAIRLKVKPGQTAVKDLLRGDVVFDNDEIEDVVLVRSNGRPTYTMAVVADDIEMNITHVIRGDDHLSNTPKQILIYNALNKTPPLFAHIPLIHDIEGKKLSKRRGAVAVEDYKGLGYLPEAIVNYLVMLGWSPKSTQELMTPEEIVKIFDIKDINLSAARFDFEKLNFFNLQYIQKLDDTILLEKIKGVVETKIGRALNTNDTERFKKIIPHAKKQNNLNAVADLLTLFLPDFTIQYDQEAMDTIQQNARLVTMLRQFVTSCSVENFKTEFDVFLNTNSLKMKDVGPVLRTMLIGKKDSCPIGIIIDALGRELAIKRMTSLPDIA
jgi:glutamyl-tRNA synthetase